MKKIIITGLAFAVGFSASALNAQTVQSAEQQPAIDKQAVDIAKASAHYLAKLPALQTGWFVTYDEVVDGREKITYVWSGTSALERGKGYRATSERGDGFREYVYDGKKFTVASLDAGYYANLDATGSFDALVTELQAEHGITLPVWEVFSADNADAFLNDIVEATYHGVTTVGGTPTHHLSFRSATEDRQMWIATDDKRPVPMMVVGTDPYQQGWPQYHAFFHQWDTAPKFAPNLFTFELTDSLRKVTLPKLRAEAGGGEIETGK
jgi:hypothetical protein